MDYETTTYKTSLDVVRARGRGSAFDEAVAAVLSWLEEATDELPKGLAAGTATESPWGHGPEELVASDLAMDAQGRRVWALEADRPDPNYQQRRWHLYIGLFEEDGQSCVLSVRETCYIWPGWFGWEPRSPDPDVPGVMAALADDDDLALLAGIIRVTARASWVSDLTQAKELAADLVDHDRGMPIIVVRANRDGTCPLSDPDALAASLAGLADVRVLDGRDRDVRWAFDELFVHGEASWAYRCQPGVIRVYQPGLDLADASPQEVGRHRFYTRQTLASILSRADGECELARQVRQALGRLVMDAPVTSISDVESARRGASSHDLAERVTNLRLRLAKATDTDSLKGQIAEWQSIAQSYADENERLRERHASMPSAWDVRRVESENERLRGREAELEAPYDALTSLTSLPHDLDDVLSLALAVWPTRLAAIADAHDSAAAFDGVSLDEAWQALRAMATDLWPMLYGDARGPDVAGRFQRASGFQVAFHEGAMTRASQSLRRMREHRYRGETMLFEAHVKGHNDSSPAKAFRIYFAKDDERRLIVIGHCGRHLDTARSTRAANGL